ncbi:MAG TPA: nucleotidyltransferase domain-containing protein [Pseudobdellovibrionaceae bacterium]|nr:nucleotidyltransferase domain-containing protein [Pseudobdellovibrionaceae bacterium]
MVRTKDEVNKIIQDYISLTSKVFKVNDVYLFGSYAYGNPKKYSDIDIAIVSPDFEYLPEDVLLKMLFKMARNVDPIIEPIPLTLEDKENPQLGSIAVDIIKKGIKVF